jgi:hypothetical protein
VKSGCTSATSSPASLSTSESGAAEADNDARLFVCASASVVESVTKSARRAGREENPELAG